MSEQAFPLAILAFVHLPFLRLESVTVRQIDCLCVQSDISGCPVRLHRLPQENAIGFASGLSKAALESTRVQPSLQACQTSPFWTPIAKKYGVPFEELLRYVLSVRPSTVALGAHDRA